MLVGSFVGWFVTDNFSKSTRQIGKKYDADADDDDDDDDDDV